jgi:DNA repair protein RecN (Recombination protein N)
MLNKLAIQNYAIIDELEINFQQGLNIITGETGAGKSILMGALGLILGNRADSTMLQDKTKKCFAEGIFDTAALKNTDEIKILFNENELEWDDELVIRREIAPNGKSRAFVNDTPVNLFVLRQLSLLLVDLHQQFDTLELGENNFQREVLDALAGNATLLHQYKIIYANYSLCKKQLEDLQQQQLSANKEFDYNKFLFDELQEANLHENELEDLDSELKLLSNAETIKQQLGNISFELNESEQPLVQQIKALSAKLQPLQQYHPELNVLAERLQSSYTELKDIAEELEKINDTVHYSPERIQIVNDKISWGYKLLKKHGVLTTNELLAIKDELQKKLDEVLNISSSISKKEAETNNLQKQALQLAEEIAEKRKKTSKPVTQKVNELLAQVGMPNALLKIDIANQEMNETGIDAVEFLFDANKSNRFEPVSKVASGGELSRLMLCIKSLVAKSLQLPTLIFDEIDTGISGEAARQVGNIMKELSAGHQLIAITHQPQIAAKAKAHFFVYKEIKGSKIVTTVKLLNNDERITTIAQMLSGEKPTAAALTNAREMMNN